MKRVLGMTVAAVALVSGPAKAAKEGELAPDFKAPSTAGHELSLQDFRGSWLVLYFYPKSFTPGCTREACSLRDGYGAIQETGARILGVSVDDLASQQKFKAENNLPFDLLADVGAGVAKAYGVASLGSFMAKRVTFLITPEGYIARVIENVDTSDHDAQVLEALRDLQTPRLG